MNETAHGTTTRRSAHHPARRPLERTPHGTPTAKRRIPVSPPHRSTPTVAAAGAALRAGRMVLLSGGDDRPHEVDLLVAAEHADAAAVNLMAREARGIVCVALPADRCDQLQLRSMRRDPRGRDLPGFTVSVEARSGVTTGISAPDRARTIAAVAAPTSTAGDLVSPGHVFPVRTHEGGLLRHPGKAEAAVALTQLAGLSAAAVTCAVMNDDGSMMTTDDARTFAFRHGLLTVDVADVRATVRGNQPRVTRIGTTTTVAPAGGVVEVIRYLAPGDGTVHAAFVVGDVRAGAAVRLQARTADLAADLLAGPTPTGPAAALQRLAASGDPGVLVYLADRTGVPGPATPATPASDAEIVASVLHDLTVHAVRLDPTADPLLTELRDLAVRVETS